jgi:hypothetical protein
MLPDNFDRRVAELWIDGSRAGYLHPRQIELLSKKQPPRRAIDLDVVLAQPDGTYREIDFAIPDRSAFVRDAATGQLSLNGQSYALIWLDDDESARLITRHFPPRSG